MTDHFEKIEAYYEGKMNPDEKSGFEAQLKQSEALREEFELYKKLRKSVIEVYEEKAIKSILEKKEKQIQKKERKIKFFPYAAVAAILAVVIGVVLHFNSDGHKMKQLADQYFTQPDPLPVLMGENHYDIKIQLGKAMQAYSRGAYEKSLNQLSDLPVSDTTLFYSGVCKFKLGKSPVEEFNGISMESAFYAKSSYYLFLFYLKSNDIDAAKKQFAILKSMNNHPYSDKIEALESEQFIKNKLLSNGN